MDDDIKKQRMELWCNVYKTAITNLMNTDAANTRANEAVNKFDAVFGYEPKELIKQKICNIIDHELVKYYLKKSDNPEYIEGWKACCNALLINIYKAEI